MPDRYDKWLKILGLAPGATEEAVRQAYRDLVKVWHPDRFGSDPRLREKAEERLRELNDAFTHLQDYRAPKSEPASSPRPSGATGNQGADHGPTARTLSISGRMATTLIVSCVAAALVAWLALAIHRAADEPSRPSLESHAQDQSPAPPERRPAPRVQMRRAEPRSGTASAAPTTGSLKVESQPTGARIVFDGEPMGETPLVITDVTPGEHHVALDLAADGYKRWSSSLVVTAGREEKLLAIMTPIPTRR
jgi:PEGA domain/DnaJ domain